MLIGTNDLYEKRGVEEILRDYEELVQLILEGAPNSQLYLQSILPTKGRENRNNVDILKINKGISMISKKYSLTYINLFDLFKTERNELNMEYSFDGLHLNGKAYLIWKDAIEQYVRQ